MLVLFSACTWFSRWYKNEHIPGKNFKSQFKRLDYCSAGCQRNVSCVAYSWNAGQKKCYLLIDNTKVSNRQAKAGTDVYIMTGRYPLPREKQCTMFVSSLNSTKRTNKNDCISYLDQVYNICFCVKTLWHIKLHHSGCHGNRQFRTNCHTFRKITIQINIFIPLWLFYNR